VTVLAALAVLRGDQETAGVLLAYTGRAILTTGIRTPVDIALYSHYLTRYGDIDAETAHRNCELAEAMSASEAVALGLAGG
jgi:hypothetical protein